MPSLLLSEIFSPHDWSVTKIIEYFYSPLSRVIHFYPLNPTMCQFGVRNVGSNDNKDFKCYFAAGVSFAIPAPVSPTNVISYH